jgi:hypothetical protein
VCALPLAPDINGIPQIHSVPVAKPPPASHPDTAYKTLTPTSKTVSAINLSTPNKLTLHAFTRNKTRLSHAISTNLSLLGTSNSNPSSPTPRLFLPNNADDILPTSILMPEASPQANPQFLFQILQVLRSGCPPPVPPPFSFEITTTAATHNLTLLASHNYDLEQVLISNPNTTSSFGSEFRSPTVLALLLSHHDLWPVIQDTLLHGATMHLTQIPDTQQRLAENHSIILRQNHKQARDNPDIIREALTKDVSLGFTCVIPIAAIQNIPHAMVCPLGMVEQHTISDSGERIPKRRLTHDQSFTALQDSKSLNNLTDITKFPELIFGFCLHRTIYQIMSLRFHYPNQKILLMKFDFSKAYRRVQYDGISATRCLSVFENFAYLQLRLSFGGMGCPASWCPFSEIITDLANELMLTADWHPTHSESPEQHLVPPTTYLADDIPFQHTLPSMLLPPPRPFGSADVYIDDVIVVFLNSPEHCRRAPSAVPLAIHLVGRPTSPNEPLPREPLISTSKLSAEGSPSETKLVLGWHLDSRRLLISLPLDKFLSWSLDLDTFISTTKAPHRKSLEQLIGRLNHASQVIPLSRFFMGRLRSKLRRANHTKSPIFFNKSDIKILRLWKTFLQKAQTGINLNLLTLRRPTNIILTDACPHGLGGFSVSSGRAWRFDLRQFSIPDNNKLEFLASVVGVLQAHFDSDIPELGNVLVLTDNSSGLCWLHRSNFDSSTHPFHAEVASKLALLCLNNNFTIHPQHIAGVHNSVADALSRTHDTDSDSLSHSILNSFPHQAPKNFKISPLHPDISSWIFSTLALHQSSSTRAQRPPTKIAIAPGDAGDSFSTPFNYPPTPSSTPSPLQHRPPYVAPFSNSSDQATSPNPPPTLLTKLIHDKYLAGVYAKPLVSWLRNSGTISGKVRFTSRKDPTSSILPSAPFSAPGTTSTQAYTGNPPSPRNISVS